MANNHKIGISFGDIWKLSFPIMLGSATQNIIALSDSLFLYGRSEAEFAAVGFVSVFYLFITAIGFGFSRGGQMLISRRWAEGAKRLVGSTFRTMLVFEWIIALILFLAMHFLCPVFFYYILDTESLADFGLEYIRYRSWGIFFSFTGISWIAYYSGIGRTKIIAVVTIFLAIVNLILNYSLIYGKFGLPEMGIAGAGLASTLAEMAAFILFLIYFLKDKNTREFQLLRITRVDRKLVKTLLYVSFPFVIQFVSSIGSWLFFFGMIENMGQRALAVSNLVRIVYIVLSIPSWGFATGVQTIVGKCIGAGYLKRVVLATNKTVILNWMITLAIALPVLLIPWDQMTEGKSYNFAMLSEAQPIFIIVLGIIICFSAGSIYHSAIMAAGAMWAGLRIQLLTIVLYLAATYYFVNHLQVSLAWVWSLEVFYWFLLGSLSFFLLLRGRWKDVKL